MSEIVHKFGFYNFTSFYEFCKDFKANKLNNTKKIYRPSQAFDSTKNENFRILVQKNNDVPRPICNIGNTCYLNAILQILFGLNKICHFEQWALQGKDFEGFFCVNIRHLLAY